MIPHGVEVFVSLDPVNLAYSFDRLAGLVQEQMGRNARDAALFVFFNRRRDHTTLCVLLLEPRKSEVRFLPVFL